MCKRVLIVDDDHDLAKLLMRRCRVMGLDAIAAHDALSALNLIHDWRPDLVCLDVTAPGGNGLGVCELLLSDEQRPRIPVIILTGRTDEGVLRHCHALCAYYVTKCANVWPRIEPLLVELLGLSPQAVAPALVATPTLTAMSVASLAPKGAGDHLNDSRFVDMVFEYLAGDPTALAASAGEPLPHYAEAGRDSTPWVLHIDDDEDFSLAVKMRLEQHGIAVVRACNGMQGFRSAFTNPADAIILDYNMPNGQGDYILRRLKESIPTRDIPVIVLTGDTKRTLERRMLDLGAEIVLHKPLEFDRLIDALREHIHVLPGAIA